MELNNLLMTNMIFNNIKINTGYQIIDSMLLILLTILITYCSSYEVRDKLFEKIKYIKLYFDTTNKIIFQSAINKKDTSKKFKAIMHFISISNDPTVKSLSEIVDFKFNRKSEEYEETKESLYRVDQTTEFNIDKNIKGKVYYEEKKISSAYGKSDYTEVMYLVIFSKNKTLLELENWVDDCVKQYEKFIRKKYCDKQLLVEISWNQETKDIDVIWNNWQSNVTFENRFFEKKDEIIKKINFFIQNPNWYAKRGIPYTMGLLLHGSPGCGKTSFIKSLMNLTGRHGIVVKLNNNFNMNKLKDIIFNDEICDNLIIPQSDRILIFEDIDCMGDIVKDRDLKIENIDDVDKITKLNILKKNVFSGSESNIDPELVNILENNNTNNNLSYFLNILDGLQECPGRIIIMTTNKLEELDKALIRPGRIDHIINFIKATNSDIINTLHFYWETNEEIQLNEMINKIYSHAEIINFCRTSESLNDTLIKINKQSLNLF